MNRRRLAGERDPSNHQINLGASGVYVDVARDYNEPIYFDLYTEVLDVDDVPQLERSSLRNFRDRHAEDADRAARPRPYHRRSGSNGRSGARRRHEREAGHRRDHYRPDSEDSLRERRIRQTAGCTPPSITPSSRSRSSRRIYTPPSPSTPSIASTFTLMRRDEARRSQRSPEAPPRESYRTVNADLGRRSQAPSPMRQPEPMFRYRYDHPNRFYGFDELGNDDNRPRDGNPPPIPPQRNAPLQAPRGYLRPSEGMLLAPQRRNGPLQAPRAYVRPSGNRTLAPQRRTRVPTDLALAPLNRIDPPKSTGATLALNELEFGSDVANPEDDSRYQEYLDLERPIFSPPPRSQAAAPVPQLPTRRQPSRGQRPATYGAAKDFGVPRGASGNQRDEGKGKEEKTEDGSGQGGAGAGVGGTK